MTATVNLNFEATAKKVIPITVAETLIPKGLYCYERLDVKESELTHPQIQMVNPCPFHSFNDAIIEEDEGSLQRAGYCSYLKLGDWMDDGTFLLFDSVKECGVKDEDEFDY